MTSVEDDPDMAAAVRRATVELTRRLAPVTTLRDPWAAAENFVAWLREQGWRPPLGPQPHWKRLHGREGADPKTNEAVQDLRRKFGMAPEGEHR